MAISKANVTRDAPRNPFPEVPGRFSPPPSPMIRIFWTKFETSDHSELVARIPEIIHDSNIKVEVARKGQLSFRH